MYRREWNSGSLVLSSRLRRVRRRGEEIFDGRQRQHHRLAPCPVEKTSRNPARDGGQAFSFRRDGGTDSARRRAPNSCRSAAQDHRVPTRHWRLREAHTTPADDGLSQPVQRSLGQLGQRALQRHPGARLNGRDSAVTAGRFTVSLLRSLPADLSARPNQAYWRRQRRHLLRSYV
jgi:hypothetical protein